MDFSDFLPVFVKIKTWISISSISEIMHLYIHNAEADDINDDDDDDENNVNLVSIRLVRMEMQVAEEGSRQPGAGTECPQEYCSAE